MLTENEKKLMEAGYSKRMVEFIVTGVHRPHPKKAKALEQLTGVPRLAWLYPDEYANPYIRTQAK